MSPYRWSQSAWPLVHLRDPKTPLRARCGCFPPLSLLADDWNAYTCGACLIPYRPGPLDPRLAP